MASPGPVLGLDYGSKRIGMAVSDVEAAFAFPVGHLERRGLRRDLEALGALIRERGVRRVVVGLPIHLDGRSGAMAEAARGFANALAESTGLTVEMLDERLTTVEAERSLRESGTRPSKHRGAVDAVAATLLLRSYLARAQSPGVPP